MLRSLFGKGKKRREPVGPAHDESIRGARVGDVLTINGYSVEYDERLLFIERIHRYSSKADTWYELLCVDGDDRLWIDWTDGRELSTTVTEDTGPVGLGSTGLSEEDLIQLDEEQSIDNCVTIDGDNYFYRNSVEVLFFQDSKGPGDAFYHWDFQQEQGQRTLSIMKWPERPFEVVFSDVVDPETITLYQGERRIS
ncbi:hypothetical protein GBAR_LOCUS25872 [Geodia barretti]|uniref:DUF4178 domain-containing protein n=1 Tax=Geodia barretti TaxID=519541 RepID=A0AA35TGQ5_GEOBA|nr:hypothetical protein GBAR_LOCUS25872 [Geodia barretti]